MKGYQGRAARAILKMRVREVAEAVGVTKNTISRFECGATCHTATLKAIKAFYVSCGIVFTERGVEVRMSE